jgi:hypothetical protein
MFKLITTFVVLTLAAKAQTNTLQLWDEQGTHYMVIKAPVTLPANVTCVLGASDFGSCSNGVLGGFQVTGKGNVNGGSPPDLAAAKGLQSWYEAVARKQWFYSHDPTSVSNGLGGITFFGNAYEFYSKADATGGIQSFIGLDSSGISTVGDLYPVFTNTYVFGNAAHTWAQLYGESLIARNGTLNINGSAVTNGNINLQPGAVVGNSSTVLNTGTPDQPAAIVKNASGTTTGDVLSIFDSAGGRVFGIIGSGDAGAPNTVGTWDIAPIGTTGTKSLGNTTHRWLKLWVGDIDFSGTITGTIPAPSNMVTTNTAQAITGQKQFATASLTNPGLYITNPAGTTTGNAFEIQDSGGTPVFKIIGSGDTGAPNTVGTWDIAPIGTSGVRKLGNSTHLWSEVWGVNGWFSGNGGFGTSTPTTSNGSVGRLVEIATGADNNAFLILSGTPTSGSSHGGGIEFRSTGSATGDHRLGQIDFLRTADVTSGKISSQADIYLNYDGTLQYALVLQPGGATFRNNVNLAGTLNTTVVGAVPFVQVVGIWDQPGMSAEFEGVSYSGTSYNLGTVLNGYSIRGDSVTPTATQSGDALLTMRGSGYGNTYFDTRAEIAMIAGSNWSASNAESYIDFYTTPNGSTTAAFRMRVNSNGSLSVGTTSNTYGLEVGGTIHTATEIVVDSGHGVHMGNLDIGNYAGRGNDSNIGAFGSDLLLQDGDTNWTGKVLVGRKTDDGSGLKFQVAGGVSATSGLISGQLHVATTSLTNPGLLVSNPAGTTTGDAFAIVDSSSNVVFRVIGSGDAGAPNFVGTQDLGPLGTSGVRSLGNSTHYWGNGYIATLNVSTAINLNGTQIADSSRNLINIASIDSSSYKAGGNVFLNSSRDATFRTITFLNGAPAPQIDATNLGAAFNFNGASSGNGNIVFNPGSVTGLSSVQINGHNNSTLSTGDLIINEVSTLGANISMKHGGTFDAAWQAGSSSAFDVVDNSSTHRFIVLQGGITLVGRTSDNGTGALLQVQGGVSFTGSMISNGTTGLTSTLTVRNSAGTGTCTLTISGGIVTASTC